MKLAIFGATGGTGNQVVIQALNQGHAVTAFVRDPARLAIEDENLTFVTGDVFDPASVTQAVQGQDAVVCALGVGSDLKKTTVRTTGTINIISSMQQNNVKRLLVVTAMGVGESWDDLSLFNKFFFATLLKSSRADHETQEAAVKESGLDWTIIRPSGLTDTPRTGVYEVGQNIPAITSKIARADVADLILKELEHDSLVGKAVTITN
jgi:putative NADH-flavin reductase